jgi:hypothetical protein
MLEIGWQVLSSERAQAFCSRFSCRLSLEAGVTSFPLSLEQVRKKHLDEEPLPLFDDTPIPEITTSASANDKTNNRKLNEERAAPAKLHLLRRSHRKSVMTTSSDLDDLTSSNLDGKRKPCA